MAGALDDLEVLADVTTQTPLGKHTLDCPLHNALW